jgi:transketolase
MLNTSLKLHPKVLTDTPEMEPIRFGFGVGLLKAAEDDAQLVGLCADLTESTRMQPFKEACPERFIEMGIAEQNMAAVAAGMAAMGKVPFIASYAMFSPGRNWEQIRTTIAYNNVPVKIVGAHAGISVGPDGGTHQAIEDIALMRCIPRMVVLSPCDTHQAKLATLYAAKSGTPVYLRLAREKTAVITTTETSFEVGKAQELWNSAKGTQSAASSGNGMSTLMNRVLLVATGTLVHNALKAAEILAAEGIGSIVLNIHTIKPLDEAAIVAAAQECGAVVSIEEHQIVGGLGSAVAECLAKYAPTRQAFIGVHDRFGQSGTMQELWTEYGLTEGDIVKAAKSIL